MVDRNLTAFHSWILFGFLSWFWCCRPGRPSRGFYFTFLRGNPLDAEIPLWNFSCHVCEPSLCLHTPYPSHCGGVVSYVWNVSDEKSDDCVMRVPGYEASLQIVLSSFFFGWFLSSLVLISVWSWEEVCSASTYSSPIFDPPIYNYWGSSNENLSCLPVSLHSCSP